MGMKKGSSLMETRRRNRILIKDTIFQMAPVARTAIADELGLTLPTITTSVNEMIAEGILRELPLPEDKLVNATGRRPVAVGFVPEAACAVGVELGPYATRAVLMDLEGNVLEMSEEAPGVADYKTMTQNLSRQVKALLDRRPGLPLLGVGIGLPGFIECDKGIIRSHRESGWSGQPLAADMEALLSLPVLIDNNVRLRAVGYAMDIKGDRPDTFAYFYISRGLACPLMVRDSVLSGYRSGAGEIGHTVVCVQTQTGLLRLSLDDLAGEQAIIDACRERMAAGGAPILRKLSEDGETLDMKRVLQAQSQGDRDVQAILQERLTFCGIALANVVNLVNPGFVVVDGYMMRSAENRETLTASARETFFGINETEVQIVFRDFDHFNGARGAAYFAIRRMFLEK